ncbi:MAG: hypothetical protein QOI24_4494 [Acidobacteriota bacterium]|nr:hypothetical protein [Acidobacteriota bacterium]
MTGHRSFSNPEATRQAIRQLIDRIARTLTHDGCAPLTWTVISPLARGADREVAAAILDNYAGRLEVVLPLELSDYRNDFEEDDDRKEFDRLFAKNAMVLALPDDDGTREDRYRRAGELVIKESEIVIAVWDGKPAAGPGGTAEIIGLALKLGRVVLWINPTQPGAPPRIIRRIAANGDVAFNRFPRKKASISRRYAQQAAYCGETVEIEQHKAHQQEFRDELLADARSAGFPFESIEDVLEPIIDEYARADQLAVHYQQRHYFAARAIPGIAAFGITVALVQVLFALPPKLIVVEVAAMVAVFFLWLISRQRSWHDKWTEYRHLAERLRSALFLILAGAIPHEVRGDDPLPFYRGPEEWPRKAIDFLGVTAAARLGERPFLQLRDFMARAWLDRQIAFHKVNAHRNHAKAKHRHVASGLLFSLTLIMALLHEQEIGHHLRLWGWTVDGAPWITLMALALPVWAGAIHAVMTQLEFERIAARSARMHEMLRGTAESMKRARNEQELRAVATTAAEQMKVENREWWILFSFQDVQLHV